ncbi:hypothetical protein J6590_056323 [Homalodisca vitripennis]|nr:hypothetical protein J6590_056323 [Homalodisca vitripennis]
MAEKTRMTTQALADHRHQKLMPTLKRSKVISYCRNMCGSQTKHWRGGRGSHVTAQKPLITKKITPTPQGSQQKRLLKFEGREDKREHVYLGEQTDYYVISHTSIGERERQRDE